MLPSLISQGKVVLVLMSEPTSSAAVIPPLGLRQATKPADWGRPDYSCDCSAVAGDSQHFADICEILLAFACLDDGTFKLGRLSRGALLDGLDRRRYGLGIGLRLPRAALARIGENDLLPVRLADGRRELARERRDRVASDLDGSVRRAGAPGALGLDPGVAAVEPGAALERPR